MNYLSKTELNNIFGGAFYTPFHLLYKLYTKIKIELIMKQIFAK